MRPGPARDEISQAIPYHYTCRESAKQPTFPYLYVSWFNLNQTSAIFQLCSADRVHSAG